MNNDKNFTVVIPNAVLTVGALCALMSSAVLVAFTFLSNETPHVIFYVVFGLFFCLGVYLIVKTLTFKVVVKGEQITAFSAFRKPYTFTFSEIVSAARQVKKNQMKSERIVIKTLSGKRLIVENSEISYKKFAKRIQQEVEKQYLNGFDL